MEALADSRGLAAHSEKTLEVSDYRRFSIIAYPAPIPLQTSHLFIPVVSKSTCPLVFGPFFPCNERGETVVGAAGKWEARVLCGIPKRSAFPLLGPAAFQPMVEIGDKMVGG